MKGDYLHFVSLSVFYKLKARIVTADIPKIRNFAMETFSMILLIK